MSLPILEWPGPTALGLQLVAVSVVVVAAVWISHLHRKVLTQCRQLHQQMSRAEQTQVELQTLLADLMATLNLSLASWDRDRNEVDEREIESIRAAVQSAIEQGRAGG